MIYLTHVTPPKREHICVFKKIERFQVKGIKWNSWKGLVPTWENKKKYDSGDFQLKVDWKNSKIELYSKRADHFDDPVVVKTQANIIKYLKKKPRPCDDCKHLFKYNLTRECDETYEQRIER